LDSRLEDEGGGHALPYLSEWCHNVPGG